MNKEDLLRYLTHLELQDSDIIELLLCYINDYQIRDAYMNRLYAKSSEI